MASKVVALEQLSRVISFPSLQSPGKRELMYSVSVYLGILVNTLLRKYTYRLGLQSVLLHQMLCFRQSCYACSYGYYS